MKYEKHLENLAGAFYRLRSDAHFCDVSIACEDQVFEAHKLVLSASSLVFKQILKKHSHPHPLIFLRGIRAVDMDALLQFVYCGEVKVRQDQLKSFKHAAEELMVQGLTADLKEGKSDVGGTQQNYQGPETLLTPESHHGPQKVLLERIRDEVMEEDCPSRPSFIEHFPPVTPLGHFDKRKSLVTCKTEMKLNESCGEVKEWADLKKFVVTTKKRDDGKLRSEHKCKLCGTAAKQKGHLLDHIEGAHFKKVLDNTCTICGKKLNTNSSLRCHTNIKHRPLKSADPQNSVSRNVVL